MTSFLLLCFNCHVVSSTCIDSAVQWTAWSAAARATWKRRRGPKVKIEDNIQRDSSFNGLQNMLVLVSYLAQAAKHQMTGFSRFGVHICISFWVELNVNKVYIRKRSFSWRLLHASNIVFKYVPPCDFGPPAATSWRRPWAYLCKVAPMAKFKYASFLIV